MRTLLKGNGVEIIEGTAKLGKPGPDGHRITVTTKDGDADDHRQERRARDRLAADRDPRLQDRSEAHHRLDRRARARPRCRSGMIVIGGGYIGLELGMVYAKFGTKVTVVEALPRAARLDGQGLRRRRRAQAQEDGRRGDDRDQGEVWEDKGDRAVLTVELKDGKTATIDADKILLSIGRRPEQREPRPRGRGRRRRQARLRHRRRSPAHERRRHLRDRRSDRRHDARAQGDQGGRGRRRDHRRPQGRVRRPHDPRGRVHRSGDRDDRPHRGRGEGQGPHRSRSASSRSPRSAARCRSTTPTASSRSSPTPRPASCSACTSSATAPAT